VPSARHLNPERHQWPAPPARRWDYSLVCRGKAGKTAFRDTAAHALVPVAAHRGFFRPELTLGAGLSVFRGRQGGEVNIQPEPIIRKGVIEGAAFPSKQALSPLTPLYEPHALEHGFKKARPRQTVAKHTQRCKVCLFRHGGQAYSGAQDSQPGKSPRT